MPDAVLLDVATVDAIRAALDGAPARCRFHGDDFGRNAGWERGLPRCESCQGPYCVQRALSLLSSARRVPVTGAVLPNVKGRCPNCGHLTLVLADGGHVTCSSGDCDDPGMADDLLGFAQRWGDRIRLVRDVDRAALVPSIEAMLFAPLTEERKSTLDERLQPLVHERLEEWAAGEATELVNPHLRAVFVDDLTAKVQAGALTVGQAWDRLNSGASPLDVSGDEPRHDAVWVLAQRAKEKAEHNAGTVISALEAAGLRVVRADERSS